MATLDLPIPGQDTGTWGQKINAALQALNHELVTTTEKANNSTGVTTGAQEWRGIKTFVDKPIVPDASFGVAKIAAVGVRDGNTYLRGDGTWEVPPGGGGDGAATGGNALGTMSNPVTDSNAPRPTGLTRVVWDCPVDPVNWAVNDYNLQKGS